MPTASTSIPEIDVGALSTALLGDAARAVAEAIVLTIDWNDENGHPLNQLQKVLLVQTAVRATANLEASFARTLVDELESEGIAAVGLSTDLEAILGVREEDEANV